MNPDVGAEANRPQCDPIRFPAPWYIPIWEQGLRAEMYNSPAEVCLHRYYGGHNFTSMGGICRNYGNEAVLIFPDSLKAPIFTMDSTDYIANLALRSVWVDVVRIYCTFQCRCGGEKINQSTAAVQQNAQFEALGRQFCVEGGIFGAGCSMYMAVTNKNSTTAAVSFKPTQTAGLSRPRTAANVTAVTSESDSKATSEAGTCDLASCLNSTESASSAAGTCSGSCPNSTDLPAAGSCGGSCTNSTDSSAKPSCPGSAGICRCTALQPNDPLGFGNRQLTSICMTVAVAAAAGSVTGNLKPGANSETGLKARGWWNWMRHGSRAGMQRDLGTVCPCNRTYVSASCCWSGEDGLVWEPVEMKVGELV